MSIENFWDTDTSFCPEFSSNPQSPKLTVAVVRSGEMIDTINHGVSALEFFAKFSTPDEPVGYYLGHVMHIVCSAGEVVCKTNSTRVECDEFCCSVQLWEDLDFHSHPIDQYTMGCCRGQVYDEYNILVSFPFFYKPLNCYSTTPFLINDPLQIKYLATANKYIATTTKEVPL